MNEKNDDKKNEIGFDISVSKWNDVIEQTIKEIGDTCQGYKWMHISLAQDMTNRYTVLIFLAIVIPPIGSLLGTISTVVENDALIVLQIICGFLGGILATIVKYGKFQNRSLEHKSASAKYASLESNIRRQLTLYRTDRVNAGKYFTWISSSFDDLFTGSPILPVTVYKKWEKISNLPIPKESPIVTVNVDTTINRELRVNQGFPSSTNLKEIGNEAIIVPELNRYGDGQMEYELGRLFGFPKN